MKVELTGVGKRYRREWILRGLDLELEPGGRYAVTGPNGSGKSTLLKMLSGHLTPTRGTISFTHAGRVLPVTEVYRHLAFTAPYIELIEEFSLLEAVDFHRRFRPLLAGLQPVDLIARMDLTKARHRPVAQFSSGMKQRLKLALACCTQVDYLLLDEPTTNLDAQGIEWYHELLRDFLGDRLLVIASNVADDYRICEREINILDYKRKKS